MDIKPLESLGDYKPRHFADGRRRDVKPIEHRSICGPAGIDHVERCVPAQEQIIVRSLASSRNTSARLVSHRIIQIATIKQYRIHVTIEASEVPIVDAPTLTVSSGMSGPWNQK